MPLQHEIEKSRTPPLRIAVFTAFYAPVLTGISIGVHYHVRGLLEKGHEVFLVHPQIDEQYPEEIRNRIMTGLDLEDLRTFPNFSSYSYPSKPLLVDKAYPEPRHYRHWSDTKLLEGFKPDIVLVEDTAYLAGLLSGFLWGGYRRPMGIEYAKKAGIPSVALHHTDWHGLIGHYIGTWPFKILYRLLATFLIKRFISVYNFGYFSCRGQVEKYRSMKYRPLEYLAFQGIDCKKFHPDNKRYDPMPKDRRPTLLFVGRISREKNIKFLLEVFLKILKKFPNSHLVIVGTGPHIKEIRKAAAKFGKSVTIWGESLGTELLGWYARADIFLNPSSTEIFCTTTNEALASGTPVVAVHSPSAHEQIIAGVNGYLAIPNDSEDFANKVVSILENPPLKMKMSQQARLKAMEFDWPVCVRNLEARLCEIANKSHRSVRPEILRNLISNEKVANYFEQSR